MKAPSLVCVTWDDAHGSATQPYDQARLHKPALMRTVGWLMAVDKVGVSLCCEKIEHEGEIGYRGHTFVPRSIVKKITRLR